MPDDLTTIEAAAYLAEQGYTINRRRAGGSGPPSADTLKHWALAGKLNGAHKRDNRWFIPRKTIEDLVRSVATSVATPPANGDTSHSNA